MRAAGVEKATVEENANSENLSTGCAREVTERKCARRPTAARKPSPKPKTWRKISKSGSKQLFRVATQAVPWTALRCVPLFGERTSAGHAQRSIDAGRAIKSVRHDCAAHREVRHAHCENASCADNGQAFITRGTLRLYWKTRRRPIVRDASLARNRRRSVGSQSAAARPPSRVVIESLGAPAPGNCLAIPFTRLLRSPHNAALSSLAASSALRTRSNTTSAIF